MQPYCPECNATVVSEDMLICKACNAVRPPFGWPIDPLLGDLVDKGRYRVNKRLGAGGFGAVYEVTHTLVDQRRAMKVMDKQLIGSSDVQRRFIDEWDILDKLKHPNIVRCFEIGILPESRQPFMLLELLEGENLFDVVWPRSSSQPNRLSAPRAARIGWQIASALTVAHGRGMLHRDLKPDNVLLVTDEHGVEQVKVIDFGIAKILGSATMDRKTSRIVGTPEYMAPEQFNPGSELDGRLDLWQLGAVLFFIITGWPPYTANDDDAFAIYRAMREREGLGPRPSDNYSRMKGFGGFDALVGQLLSTSPEDRPKDAVMVTELITALFERELNDGQPPPSYNTGYGRHSTGQHPPVNPGLARIESAPSPPAMTNAGLPPEPVRGEREASTRQVSAKAATKVPRPAARKSTDKEPSPRVTQPRPARQTSKKRPKPEQAPTEIVEQKPNEMRTLAITLGVALILLILIGVGFIVVWKVLPGSSEDNLKPTYVQIGAGRFAMGSPHEEIGRSSNETRHDVTITNAFMMQSTEVTQGQWQRLMGNNPSHFKECGSDCPVENVSWWDAIEYLNRLSSADGFRQCYVLSGCTGTPGVNFECEQMSFTGLECTGYRLPTEAEWEYAARAGTGSALYNGNLNEDATQCKPIEKHLDEIAWYCGNAKSKPHTVGSLDPNFWRLHDMLGNVSEWVWDWNYGDYDAGQATDPLGPAKGAGRTYRGGSWISFAKDSRLSTRNYSEPARRHNNLGFRAVRSVR